jgi:hypothetical protein
MPQPKVRSVLFHVGESIGGSGIGGITGMNAAFVNHHCEPPGLRYAQSD